jgi:hypothetical protein
VEPGKCVIYDERLMKLARSEERASLDARSLKLRPARRVRFVGCVRLARPHAPVELSGARAVPDERSFE